MSAPRDISFASLLDDLIAAARDSEPPQPAEPVSLEADMLAQIERLRAANPSLMGAAGVSAYRDAFETEQRSERARPDATDARLEPALEDLFFLDPASIARELNLSGLRSGSDLDRARRSFAMRNHPDRVPESMRERAKMRMQIANMLIDEAKRAKR